MFGFFKRQSYFIIIKDKSGRVVRTISNSLSDNAISGFYTNAKSYTHNQNGDPTWYMPDTITSSIIQTDGTRFVIPGGYSVQYIVR